VRYSELSRFLQRHKPHIVHFSGHGSASGELAFSDDAGKSHLVHPDTLADLFNILRGNVRCVVLNACYSEEQAQGIAKSIDCVVGMTRAVPDQAALQFAAAFYEGLGYGGSIAQAFGLGRNRMGAYVAGEETTPKLLDPNNKAASIIFAGAQAAAPGASSAVKTAPPLRELKGQQLQAAMNALLAAYQSESDLALMVQIGMNENLAAIVGGSALRDKVFNLLQWARMRGRLTELLQAALDGNPGSPELQEFIAGLQ
jgi:hypothetical protein